ncbi:MAG: chromosomal replication initiator protein DnaA, partial [Verrucomicrobiales bacterium]
ERGREERTKLTPQVLVEKVSEKKLLERGRAAGLVEIFRFENFVPGENSELAWAASRAVADQPGKTYQPLFFHSACGLGKTHLLHGIGWESLRLRPKSKIIFVTAEQFANDYIDAIQKNALVPFRRRYREADLLLIDDVQFLGRKEGLQREFFHTFNRLADMRKQIVLASDCPASEINELEERLVSRFQWGLSVEIHRPGLETRAAILRRKRDDWKMQVSDELINVIVERVRGNVRALEGALIRVAMVTTMNEEPISPEQVAEIIADICDGQDTRQVGAEEIKRAVAEHYDIDVQILSGKKRTARIAEARQVAMYLVRTLTDLSLVEVAAGFAKDHGTVIYAVRKVKKRCDDSASFKSTVELIKRRLVRGGSSVESPRQSRGQYPPNFRLGSKAFGAGGE